LTPGDDGHLRLVQQFESKVGKPEEKVVSGHPIYLEGIYIGEAQQDTSYTFNHYLPKEGWKRINIPAASIHDGRGVPELARGGVVVRDRQLLAQYIHEQAEKLNVSNARSIRYEQCGWKNGNKEFVLGTLLFKDDGTVVAIVASDEILARAKLGLIAAPGSNARDWVSLSNVLFKPDHLCAWGCIGASFGSVFSPWHSRSDGGTALHLFSPESGLGKSIIMEFATGIWGKWHALAIKDHDTLASHGLILTALGNLPCFIDEISHFAKDQQFGILKLRNLIDIWASGTDKHRALQHGTGLRHQLCTWSNHLMSTGNTSVIDMIEVAGNVGNQSAMRVCEQRMPIVEQDQYLGNTLRNKILDVSGHAGPEFIKFLMRPDVMAAAPKMLADWTNAIWRSSGLPQEQRFRARLIGSTSVAMYLAQERGLFPAAVDQHAVTQWQVEQLRNYAREIGVPVSMTKYGLQALDEFLKENTANTLRVQHPYRHGIMQMPLSKPNRLLIRHETGENRVLFSRKLFREFVVKHGYSYNDVIKELGDIGVLKTDKKLVTLGAGTEFASSQVLCIECEVKHPALRIVENPNVETASTTQTGN